MSDDDFETVAPRRAVSSGEASLDGDEHERALSDTEIPKVQKTKELAAQMKGPSSAELEEECEKSRIEAVKAEIPEKAPDEYINLDSEGFEDILGGGDIWKKTIKEGKGERGAPSQMAEILVRRLDENVDPKEEVTEITFPLGYHYVLDAWELAVQLMVPGEVCALKCTPRFVDGGKSKELFYKYEIELKSLGKFIDFNEMSTEETIEFLKNLNKRGDYYFTQDMVEHALQLNSRALDIIRQELEDGKEFQEVKLNLLISASHYYLRIDEATEGMRVVNEGLAIAPENTKLLYLQSRFHSMRKEFKQCIANLKLLIAKGITSEAIDAELKKAQIDVKEQLEKEKQVYKRMFAPAPKPPRKEQQKKNNGLSPTKRYMILAGAVCFFAILFQTIRYFYNNRHH